MLPVLTCIEDRFGSTAYCWPRHPGRNVIVVMWHSLVRPQQVYVLGHGHQNSGQLIGQVGFDLPQVDKEMLFSSSAACFVLSWHMTVMVQLPSRLLRAPTSCELVRVWYCIDHWSTKPASIRGVCSPLRHLVYLCSARLPETSTRPSSTSC